MFRGKPIPVGPTARLPEGMTWENSPAWRPSDPRPGSFSQGLFAVAAPHQQVGGMVFPQHQIKQFARLDRFDVDFDLPEHFLPEFPAGHVPDHSARSRATFPRARSSRWKISRSSFQGILNAKGMEGMRLLVTQFPQQQFNATADRKAAHPDGMKGVACFDCHVNGHTSPPPTWWATSGRNSTAAASTPSACAASTSSGIFGSQRGMKPVEDFTQFEQLGRLFRRRPGYRHRPRG